MAINVTINHDCSGTSSASRIFVICDSTTSQIFTCQLLLNGTVVSSTLTSPGANTHFVFSFYDTANGTHTIKAWGSVDPESSTVYDPSNSVTLACTAPVVCDLAYTTATTTPARNGQTNGSITAHATSSVAIQYSLDSLYAWQSSNVFNNVGPGYHAIYFKDANNCTATQYNVLVANLSCDLTVTGFTVTHETGEGLNDGTATYTATSGDGTVKYKIDGGSYTTLSSGVSKTFTGLAPGVHTVVITDGSGCTTTRFFTINEYKPAYVFVSPANSLRFISQGTPQNFDNTLFADMYFPGYRKVCYYQPVAKTDGAMVIQWQSNYSNNLIEVTNIHTGTVTNFTGTAPTLPFDYVLPADYNYIEASINWGSLASGYYSIKIKGTDTVRGSYEILGEPVELRSTFPDTNLITYKNIDSAFEIEYLTGITHKIRVLSRFAEVTNPGKRTVIQDGSGRTIKLSERLSRKIKLRTFQAPFYVHEKLSIAFAMDYLAVNGQEFASEENYDVKEPALYPLGSGEVDLTQVNFNIYNRHDSGDINTPSDGYLSLDNGGYLKL